MNIEKLNFIVCVALVAMWTFAYWIVIPFAILEDPYSKWYVWVTNLIVSGIVLAICIPVIRLTYQKMQLRIRKDKEENNV